MLRIHDDESCVFGRWIRLNIVSVFFQETSSYRLLCDPKTSTALRLRTIVLIQIHNMIRSLALLQINTLVRIIETQQQQRRRLRRANHANRINSMLSPVASFAHSQLVDELTGISSVKPPSLTLLFYVFIRVHLGFFLLTRRFFLISLLSSR